MRGSKLIVQSIAEFASLSTPVPLFYSVYPYKILIRTILYHCKYDECQCDPVDHKGIQGVVSKKL